MFEKYLASSEDLFAVEEALSYIWHPKMNFVFKDRSRISKTLVTSYDSKFLYVWRPEFGNEKGRYKLHKRLHKLRIINEWQSAWWAGLYAKELEKLLPITVRRATRFEIPLVSGGLLFPFLNLQKLKNVVANPYTTKESYLATIIHEFGHVYWDSFKMWWPSNKKQNIDYLTLAKNLYSGKELEKDVDILISTNHSLGEIYAYCCEYYASEKLLPLHNKNLDLFAKNIIEKLLIKEGKKNLDQEDSVIDAQRQPHNTSIVLGKIIMSKYPSRWPQFLTDPKRFSAII